MSYPLKWGCAPLSMQGAWRNRYGDDRETASDSREMDRCLEVGIHGQKEKRMGGNIICSDCSVRGNRRQRKNGRKSMCENNKEE